jgi:putative solute:sodium symporter small subunit
MDDAPRNRFYFTRTALLAAFVVGGMLAFVLAVVLNVKALDRIVILAFPFGFWLIAQGALILAAIAAFWFAARQEQMDRTAGASEDG